MYRKKRLFPLATRKRTTDYGRAVLLTSALLFWQTIPFADAPGADWPQWTGPNRDSYWPESGVISKFPPGGPKVEWRTKIAGGYSGPAVANGRVYVTDFLKSSGEATNDPGKRPQLKGQERVHCLDMKTGKMLWSHAYDTTYEISYPAGPRATPAVDGDRVYTLGAEGQLSCLSVADGKVVWDVNVRQRYGATTPLWGYVSHPLVYGDLVYCLAGGQGSVVVALDKLTGKERWKALSTAADCGYSPPTMIDSRAGKQLVVWHPQAVSGLDPASGTEIWNVSLVPEYGMSINPPRQNGDLLFIGGIYDKAVLLQLKPDGKVDEIWRASKGKGVGPVHSPPLMDGKVMYGVDSKGELTAVNLADGRQLWRTLAPTTGQRPVNSGTGFLVKNNDLTFIFSETGDLVITRLSPEKYEELSRAKILEPTHEAFGRQVVWSHPAFANRRMFARNDKEIVCVSLAAD